jgi:hypothetical protein
MRWRTFLVVALLLSVAGTSPAGLFFGKKKQKPAPNERVPELITIIRTDGDENKRQDAVEEVRQYDPAAFPAIVPTLVEALRMDKKPAVRAEAAQSLSKLRPVSPEVGQALEQAVHSDPSVRVRLQARSALLHYHWAGYHSGKDVPPPEAIAKDPPGTPPAISTSAKPPARFPLAPAPTPIRPTTQEPPLAPLPPPAPMPIKPIAPAKLPAGPPSAPPSEGPDLGAPPTE